MNTRTPRFRTVRRAALAGLSVVLVAGCASAEKTATSSSNALGPKYGILRNTGRAAIGTPASIRQMQSLTNEGICSGRKPASTFGAKTSRK